MRTADCGVMEFKNCQMYYAVWGFML